MPILPSSKAVQILNHVIEEAVIRLSTYTRKEQCAEAYHDSMQTQQMMKNLMPIISEQDKKSINPILMIQLYIEVDRLTTLIRQHTQ